MASLLSSAAQPPRTFRFTDPDVRVYLPPGDLNTGTALVILPGGGYGMTAMDHEGYDWAPWFNERGITVAVVNYTLPGGDREKPMADVEAAFSLLADSAAVWGIDPTRIGIMGSSAGGHLASTMATHPRGNCRPAFQILLYPVISLDLDITHRGTRNGFLGENPDEALVKEFSSDNKVTPATPPAVMLLSGDDRTVPVENSLRYYRSLINNGVNATMMIYPSGGHGWGYRPQFRHHRQMLTDLDYWIRTITAKK